MDGLKFNYEQQIEHLEKLPDFITIYRGLGFDADELDDFMNLINEGRSEAVLKYLSGAEYQGIGESWSLSKEIALAVPFTTNWWNYGMIFTGVVAKKDINIKETIVRNLNVYYKEQEITIAKGKLISVSAIEEVDFADKEILTTINLKKQIAVPAFINLGKR